MITGEAAMINNLIRASAVDFNALNTIGCVQLGAMPGVSFGSGTDLIIHLCDTGRSTLRQKQKLAVSGLWPEPQAAKAPLPVRLFCRSERGADVIWTYRSVSSPFHAAEKTPEFL
ncbi:hypothetical protein [Oscillibacter sp.]|uniref:hypothetical protein n=1 Tax=Oscillibacter sp. TaxID=1945593 RepID=UPI002897401F|nr:hypothetical protein [Oscillibacter sp.]